MLGGKSAVVAVHAISSLMLAESMAEGTLVLFIFFLSCLWVTVVWICIGIFQPLKVIARMIAVNPAGPILALSTFLIAVGDLARAIGAIPDSVTSLQVDVKSLEADVKSLERKILDVLVLVDVDPLTGQTRLGSGEGMSQPLSTKLTTKFRRAQEHVQKQELEQALKEAEGMDKILPGFLGLKAGRSLTGEPRPTRLSVYKPSPQTGR